jgi:hypothetical protein
MSPNSNFSRRNFLGLLGAGGLGLAAPVGLKASETKAVPADEKPATNIQDALKYPRNEMSMPGKFPGKVVKVVHSNPFVNDAPSEEAAYAMIASGIMKLTGKPSVNKGIRMFVGKDDRIGLKVNPVAGKSLSTSHAVVKAMIKHLEESGIPRKNLMIWDRREFELADCGFSAEAYPEIKIRGTEQMDSSGSYYNKEGKLYGELMIDKNWYYWADVEGEYDEYTMPYMVNGGKYSYFSRICTEEVDKIINIPILKNAGSSITVALKNLAYGSVSNTGRLHKDLWAETCAEVCAFPPLRDKVVLNIVDGLRGCFNGGPAANPQFFTDYRMMIIGTDPVAVDRIGYDVVINKRIAEGLQTEDLPKGRKFLEIAGKLGLGECDISRIGLEEIELS